MPTRTVHRGFVFTVLAIAMSIIAIALIGSGSLARFMPRRFTCNLSSCASPCLQGNVAVLRHALELYTEEHGGARPSLAEISTQLTMYSDVSGASTLSSKDDGHALGPYVRSVPALPIGVRKGMNGISDTDGPGVGWIYNEATGAIRANTTTEVDERGQLYCAY